ncbi:BTAD domain-containing putative transcriptional regulator [Kitasatospora sp. NPDC059795]|uniref:AfsR/SARP family transcriptional regulator n=1 Tax=Kitasatospora sp. NPDC059795 TaxID=3346949 RepID=UPI0036696FAC
METAATDQGLRFRLLGPLAGWAGGQRLELGRRQQQAFLAMLAAAPGRVLTAAQLGDGIFDGDNPPGNPRSVLATHAYRLRRELRNHALGHLLVTVDGGYRLDVPAEALDSVAFDRLVARAGEALAGGEPAGEALAGGEPAGGGRDGGGRAGARDLLARALALYEGEPLAGLPGRHAEELRRHLGERRIDALETKLGLDVELGSGPSCLVELDQAVFAHPFRERFRALLMLEYHLSGRPEEARAVYEDARRLYLDEGLTCAELDALHRRIRRADPTLATAARPAPETRPSGPAPTPVPEQLPAGIPDFTGRQADVARLRAALSDPEPGAVVISAINGLGGVGKTGLAVHVGHALRARFPDGRLHVDLRGAEAVPLDPAEALAGFLTALGVADRDIPADLAERAALYRTAVTGRRLLILLDNAAGPEQVAPLLPGSRTCAVLVTSRAWLSTLPGARHLPLDAMTADEALDLLAAIVGRPRIEAEPEAAATIVTACGRLPLAVRVAGSRLAADPGQPLAELAASLADERTRLGELATEQASVEPVLALSYARLTAEQARALRLLALPDAPDLRSADAAALLDRDPAETRDLLEALVDLNLLQSPAADRYGFHDLLRVFARQRSAHQDTPSSVTAAFARLLGFCVAGARNAERTAHRDRAPESPTGPRFSSIEEASAWMRDRTALHRAVVHRACEDGGLPLADTVDLLDTMSSILFGRGYVTTVADLAGRVAAAASARGERDAEALARSVRGGMLWHANSYPQAGRELRACLALCDGDDRLPLRADTLKLLGANARALRDHRAAVACLEEAAAIFRRLADESAEGLVLGELAFNQAQLGLLSEARATAERCAGLTGRHLSISESVGRYYLARVLHLCGDLDPALAQAQYVLERFRAFGMLAFEAATGSLIARIHLSAGRARPAVRAAEESLPQARQVGALLEGTLLRTLGEALTRLHHPDRARISLQQALTHFRHLELTADATEIEHLLREIPQ